MIFGKRLIQEASNTIRIADLQTVQFRHLSWVNRVGLEMSLKTVLVILGIRIGSDKRKLQIQDLFRLEANAFQFYIPVAQGRPGLSNIICQISAEECPIWDLSPRGRE